MTSAMTSAPDRLLRLPEVIHRVGLSRTTIYSLIATGEFPRQIVIGPRAVAWSQQELEAWMNEKRQSSSAPDGSLAGQSRVQV
jgi:prophage regulatory protein